MEEEETYYPPLERKPAYRPAWDRGQIVQGVEDRKNYDAQQVGFTDAVGMSFRSGGNFAVQIAKDLERISTSPDDPQWDKDKDTWIRSNKERIGEHNAWRYRQTRSPIEAERMLADQETAAKDIDILARRGGVGTFIAEGIAGLLDVDTPLSILTGGLTAASKAGINATKIGRLMSGAAAGGLVGATAAGMDFAADPNADWTLIPIAGLGGIAFGGLGGALSRGRPDIATSSPAQAANRARTATLNEFGETLNDGMPRASEDLRKETFENADPYLSEWAENQAQRAKEEQEATSKATDAPDAKRAPKAIDVDELERPAITDVEIPQEGRSSIGARQLGNSGPGIASIRSQRIQDTILNARQRVTQLGVHKEWLDGWANVNSPIGRYAERFHNVISNSPLATDFARMMNSGSAVAQTVAYDLLENASGIVRNGRSAARLMDFYQRDMLNRFQGFHDSYAEWAGSAKGAGFIRREWDTDLRDEFNKEVAKELQARFYDGKGMNAPDSAVAKAADSIDNMFAREVDVSTGRPGETAIRGAQNLKKQSGYMPHKWSGLNMKKILSSGKKRKDIVDAIAEGYRKQFPAMSAKDSRTYADAVVGRAEKFEEGINTSLIGILQADGRVELADVLRRQGMGEKEINAFIDRLTGSLEERGAPGHTKQRMDIDLRYTATNGIRILDLVDTDFATMIPKRVRKSAGLAALARKGIASRQDWEDIKAAVKAEQVANGKSAPSGTGVRDKIADTIDSDKHIDDEFLDNIYTYFNGAPIAGGISPIYARIKKLTNLALLNQLGLTQLAELGPTISAVGIQQFFRHAGEAITGELRKADSPLVQELKHMSIFIPEERLFRDDLVHEFEKHTSVSEWMRGFDRILNKAQRVQGYTSGFYHMRRLQQRIAVTAAADKLAKHFRDGGLISDDRLRDMGFTPNDLKALEQYVKNGTVQFDNQGNLTRLNLSKWSPEDVELFATTINASTNTLVQKAMAGESSMLFHKDGLAQLFFHLKAFPMLALEKQLLRQTRFMDAELLMSFTYGLMTAASAYTARQVINGREDNLTFEKIAKGAFGYSNMTGWLPMWTDPLAGMLGMDSLQMGGYQGRATSVISTPAALGTIDRMLQVPGAVISGATGDLSTGDVNAIMATPLIGNAYGFAYIFNAIKDDIRSR